MRQFIYFIFNPRLREGGDNSALSTLIRYKSFQSTPPRRRRRRRVFHSKRWMLFNPRLREGGDFYYAGNNVFTKLFNPRLREGGDDNSTGKVAAIVGFQSTPPRRRRLDLSFTFCTSSLLFSIHASAKEATLDFIYRYSLLCKFSIHASAKEATATYCNTPAIMCISSLNNFFVHHF